MKAVLLGVTEFPPGDISADIKRIQSGQRDGHNSKLTRAARAPGRRVAAPHPLPGLIEVG
jgi:hypothetical protein